MPDVGDVVHGLLHRTEQQRLEHVLLRVVGDLAQPPRDAVRLLHLLHVEGRAQSLRDALQSIELLRVGLAVHAVHGGRASLAEPLCDQLICQDHELLDHLVGALDAGVLRAPGDADGVARLVVQDELRLGQVEVESPAAHPLLPELPRDLIERLELLAKRLRLMAPRRQLGEAQGARDAAVGEHRVSAHAGLAHLEVRHVAVRVDVGEHRHAEPLALGQERAHVRGERAGEHRQGAIGQVDRAAAHQRLLVEGSAGLHVLGNVGDAHPHPVAVAVALDGDRVVVIARVLRIDGEQRNLAQVLPMLHVAAREAGGHRLRLAHGPLRVLLLDALAHEDLRDLHTGVARCSEHAEELALRALVGALRVTLYHDHGGVAVATLFRNLCEHDGPADAGVVGLEPRARAPLPEHACHADRATGDDVLDAPFGAPRGVRDDADHDTVAVERAAERFLRHVDVVVSGARDEAEAAWIDGERALPGVFLAALGCMQGAASALAPWVCLRLHVSLRHSPAPGATKGWEQSRFIGCFKWIGMPMRRTPRLTTIQSRCTRFFIP